MYIRKVKKSESKSQLVAEQRHLRLWLCISVKLKNLKANHNYGNRETWQNLVVYIRKVKKSESKSQRSDLLRFPSGVVYIRKVKKSESKSQLVHVITEDSVSCVYP